MRILLDQGTPAPLRAALVGHVVVTAYEHGWSTMTNGALLDAAFEDGFGLILCTDQNIRYQQNLVGRRSPSWCCRRRVGRAAGDTSTRSVPQSVPWEPTPTWS
jgi:hypothetical protein